jgi:3-isopropylmalate/(R)-2-methylmalate dehydratase small subunit
MIVEGRAWVFGDGVDTDLLAPGVYMKHPIDVIAAHCLESLDPTFASDVRPGDILVAGANFGLGSAREQAAQALTHLGVGAVVVQSVARIFYRNALNLGLPVVLLPDTSTILAGARLSVDIERGVVTDLGTGVDHRVDPIPPHLLDMLRDGGLMPHLKKRFAERTAS